MYHKLHMVMLKMKRMKITYKKLMKIITSEVIIMILKIIVTSRMMKP